MRLNRTTRSGTISIYVVAYSLMALYYLVMLGGGRHSQRRSNPTVEYYSPTAGLAVSQCGPNGCYTPVEPQSYQQPGRVNYRWSTGPGPWTLDANGQDIGTLFPNGTYLNRSGDPAPCPADWFTEAQKSRGVDRLVQRVADNVGQGGPPPDGTVKVGQLPPTGVDKGEVAKDKARVPSGVTINGSPATESLARSALSDSAKQQGLRDYEGVLRLVVCGEGRERASFVAAAKPTADASQGKLIIQEYEPGDWQCVAHANAVKSLPEYQPGAPFAYVQRGDGTVKTIAFTASEVSHSMKQLRPEVAPNFDAAKARAISQASDSWLIWASGAFIAICGLFGAVTTKQQ